MPKFQDFPNVTQETMRMHNLLSLPQLIAKQTKGKEPLVDYSKSYVFFYQYIDILHKKAMDKTTIEEIKEVRQKEKKEKNPKKCIQMVIRLENATYRLLKKCASINFVSTWILNVVREVGDCFHNNFNVGF
jgi:replicative DNA helicase